MITGLAHVNLTVPPGTLDLANEFYGTTLGLTPRPVPHLQKGMLAWFDIGTSGQQVHIAFGENEGNSPRHPCFQLPSGEKLVELQGRIWEHFEKGRKEGALKKKGEEEGVVVNGVNGTETEAGKGSVGSRSAPREADRPGMENSGAQGVEYPKRFFARDYAGNRLEFSL